MQSQKIRKDLNPFPRHSKAFNTTVIQVNASTTDAKEVEGEQSCEDLQYLLDLIPPKDDLFILGDWNSKRVSQGTLGITGKFSLGV